MKQDRYGSLPVVLIFLALWLTLMHVTVAAVQSETDEATQKGLISFVFPWTIETKTEVNLTAKLINLASKSVSNTVDMLELIQMLDGIYVRTFDRTVVDEQELVNYFRWKLKADGWEVPVKIKADDESIEINLLFDENTVYGIFIIVIPERAEEITFVNIVGKIAPERIENLLRNLSNFGVMDIDVRRKLRRQAASTPSTRRRELLAVKIDYPPTIDGILDDVCWKIAPQADGFTHTYFERPVEDDTVVKLVYTPKAIYVGWHLYDSQPNKIVAIQTKDQDNFYGITEDWVSFSIDPFHSHRFGNRFYFMANSLGKKFVYIPVEHTDQDKWIDRWNVAAKIVEDGWTVEMEIPWQMLDYPETTEPIQMGLNFDRAQARTRTHSWWSNIGFPERYKDDGHWMHVLPPPKSINTQGLLDTLDIKAYSE